MDSAPWWFIPLVTFGGVLLAQLVVLFVTFAKFRTDDKRRWHERRLEAYSRFQIALGNFASPCIAHAVALNEGKKPDRTWIVEVIRPVNEAFFDIELLASEPVSRAAWMVKNDAGGLRQLESLHHDDWYERLVEMENHKFQFLDAVRVELGITRRLVESEPSQYTRWDSPEHSRHRGADQTGSSASD